jgi:hypothetical protein
MPAPSLPAPTQTLPTQTASSNLPTDRPTDRPAPPSDRHLLTQVASYPLSFPMQWVTDIIQVDRTKILPLPLYPDLLWGLVNYQSKMVPLVLCQPAACNSSGSPSQASSQASSQARTAPGTPLILAVRLSKALGKLEGVGIVIDRVVGSTTADLLPPESSFQPSDLPAEIWQPLRHLV